MNYNKKIILKNGKECIIRNAEASDAKAVYDSFMLTHSESEFLLSYPEENSFTVKEEEKFLADKTESENETELCAVVDGKIVGTAGIKAVGTKCKIKHRAEFGISIENAYQGLGIGRALTEACIECARKAGYIQLELDVVRDNVKALSLYKSVGFTEYGSNPLGFKEKDGSFRELVLMRLCL